MRTLSVVVPATDRPATLSRAVTAIRSALEPPEEIIVVDAPRGLGPAGARNRGAERASGEILVFVDADVEVHDDTFVLIRAAFEKDPTLDAVFGSYDDDPEVPGLVSGFRNLLHHHVHQQGAGAATTFWAGLGAIRRLVFDEMGGFDEARFPHPSVEDIELGARIHANGGRILLDPTIQGTHLKSWSLGTMTETDLLRRGVPWLRLVLEQRATRSALNLGWRHRLSAVASALLLLGVLRRHGRLVVSMLAVLIVTDTAFFRLLLRRRGVRQLVAGVPLYVLHRLTAVAAVPIALVGHAAETWRVRRARA